MREIRLELPEEASGDQLRSLRDWLTHEGELRGRVDFAEGEPPPGTLSGGMPETLIALVGSGGAVTVLISGIISWLRQVSVQRREPTPVKVTLKRSDGSSVTLETELIRGWTQSELSDQIAHFSELMAE